VQAQFPHKIIPHTVLLDASGIVRAITEPSQVTKKVIGQLVAGKTIAVPLKEDLQYTNPQLIADTYFAASAHTASRVLIQPEVPGAASYENRYANDSAFQNRRITFINIPLLDMYRLAHGDISRLRTISQRTGGESPSYLQKYCLDIIVDKGKEKTLLPRLAKELRDRFSIQGKREKQSQPVYVLQVADQSKAGQLTASSQGDGYLMAQADSFEGKELKINQLTQYLENFGILPLPVVDETGLKAVYNISLKFEPERKESLLMALHQIGLQLTESQREIEVLLLK
jgi:uncharacterized protein (TIGR03435 family)